MNGLLEQFALIGLVAQSLDTQLRAGRVENTQHDLLAVQGRAGRDTEIDGPILVQIELDAPVLRHASFSQVEARHHLQSRGQAHPQRGRRGGDLAQHAVLAQADPVFLFVGLEMDIRRALVDGVQHDLIDEAHDWRIVGVDTAAVSGVGLARRIDSQIVEGYVVEPGHGAVDGAEGTVDCLGQLVLLDQDRLDVQASAELELVECLQIGRIGDRHEEVAAALVQRQHAVLADERLGYEFDRRLGEIDRTQVQQRHREFFARGLRQNRGGEHAARHDPRNERFVLAMGLSLDLECLVGLDKTILDQLPGEAAQCRRRDLLFIRGHVGFPWLLREAASVAARRA